MSAIISALNAIVQFIYNFLLSLWQAILDVLAKFANFIYSLIEKFLDFAFNTANSLLDEVLQLKNSILSPLLHSDFFVLMNSLNYFLPVDEFFTVLSLIASMAALYWTYRLITKVIDWVTW